MSFCEQTIEVAPDMNWYEIADYWVVVCVCVVPRKKLFAIEMRRKRTSSRIYMFAILSREEVKSIFRHFIREDRSIKIYLLFITLSIWI